MVKYLKNIAFLNFVSKELEYPDEKNLFKRSIFSTFMQTFSYLCMPTSYPKPTSKIKEDSVYKIKSIMRTLNILCFNYRQSKIIT